MIVTLDFICLRLSPATGVPEVMLLKRNRPPAQGQFALVGGWVRENSQDPGQPSDKTLADATQRILREKVGFDPSYLEQVPCEGGLSRDPDRGWSVTVPFLCLFNRPDMQALDTRDGIRWEPVSRILGGDYTLPFDHALLAQKAFDAFLNKIRYSSLLLYLLPEKVAVSQIVNTYETLGIRVTKQTVFSRWITPGLLVDTGEHRAIARKGQPSRLYRLQETSLSYFESEIGKQYKGQTLS